MGKTEANREKERESQDEPIVDKSNAHGPRGEILRGLVRSRVGHHYVPKGFLHPTVAPCLTAGNRVSPSAQAASVTSEPRARDIAVSRTLAYGRLPTRLETVGPPSRFGPLRRAPPFRGHARCLRGRRDPIP